MMVAVVAAMVAMWFRGSYYGNAATTIVVVRSDTAAKTTISTIDLFVVGLVSVNRTDQERKTCWKRVGDDRRPDDGATHGGPVMVVVCQVHVHIMKEPMKVIKGSQ